MNKYSNWYEVLAIYSFSLQYTSLFQAVPNVNIYFVFFFSNGRNIFRDNNNELEEGPSALNLGSSQGDSRKDSFCGSSESDTMADLEEDVSQKKEEMVRILL